jgi:hypothetical protein
MIFRIHRSLTVDNILEVKITWHHRLSKAISAKRVVTPTRFQDFRKALRVIHKLLKANNVVIWAVFFIKPR